MQSGAERLTRSSRRAPGQLLNRTQFLERKSLPPVAAQASASLGQGDRIKVSPHVLRHTFLRTLAEEKGVHYAKDALGHGSDRYIWRYVKSNAESLANTFNALD